MQSDEQPKAGSAAPQAEKPVEKQPETSQAARPVEKKPEAPQAAQPAEKKPEAPLAAQPVEKQLETPLAAHPEPVTEPLRPSAGPEPKKPGTKPLPEPPLETDQTTLHGEVEPQRIAFGALALPPKVQYKKTGPLPQLPAPWRIQLVAEGGEVIGLDLVGDTILGRGEKVSPPTGADLSTFGAKEKGVSRQHVMLRPGASRLYLIDLGSTNGTLHNSVPVGPGIARVLSDGDVLMLGNLTLTLRIVTAPEGELQVKQ
jgi:hypothetical protein